MIGSVKSDALYAFLYSPLFILFSTFFVNKKYISLHLVCLNDIFNVFLVRLAGKMEVSLRCVAVKCFCINSDGPD